MGGHLAFLKGKWKEIENSKKQAEELFMQYGDNSVLVSRHITAPATLHRSPHSFSFLLHVNHLVEVIPNYAGPSELPIKKTYHVEKSRYTRSQYGNQGFDG
jgi:hypothetical protein